MNIAQIEKKLHKLIDSFSKETFIYDLFLAYGLPKASITRLKKGNLNLSKADDEISWKKKVFFKEVFNQDLHVAISALVNEIKHDQRFVIVTDYETLLAIDTKTQDKLDIDLKDLPKHYDFFLPWAGMEKTQHQNENPADVKAAEKMARLFDEIKKNNPDDSPEFIHGLNVFLSRLLFCFFAEDTNIFEDGQFTNAIASHTQTDGSDLNTYLDKLFDVLDTPEKDRKDLPDYLNAFPYVNGGLFGQRLQVPSFTRRSRQAIIDSGELDWSAINPDIFGSMMQAVITPDQRGGLGMHYTSVPNIMKVIEPLFLNDLKEAFEKAKGNEEKIKKLLHRLETIKIFDPACGSGNFLIIAYKELRKLEMEIYKERRSISLHSLISLEQFYGIELDDFAHEISQLSLWLAKHQMDVEFFKEFGCTNPPLPLKEAGNVVQGNACRIDWETVCPKKEDDEIYILGNPPYLGTRNQNKEQKSDIDYVFKKFNKRRKLDYISSWFYLASKFIHNCVGSYAFVSTNSISQGEQVPILWPLVLENSNDIFFAYTSFKWSNNAKSNAGVTVVIIGVSRKSDKRRKSLYSENLVNHPNEINPYLAPATTLYIESRNNTLSDLPKMVRGNYTGCCNALIITENEKEDLVNQNNESIKFIRRLIGSNEFINGTIRYCLWISEHDLANARGIEGIYNRIEDVRKRRESSSDLGQQNIADKAYQFREFNETKTTSVIVPVVSSERRIYIPCGFINAGQIVPNSAQIIYDCESWILGLISSRIHNIWIKTVAGRLENRIRYASSLCYNTFPIQSISKQRKKEITQCTLRILEEREKHPEKTLAQLYDPDKMPEGLREAHRLNDLAVEHCYRSKPFENDEERLEYLFQLYEKMIAEEQEN